MKRRKPVGNKRELGGIKTLLIGVGISLILTVLLVMLFAKLILSGTVAEGAIPWVALGIIFLSVLCGSFFSAKCSKQKKLPFGMANAGIYFLLIGAIHALLMQQGYGNVLEIAACCMVGGLLGSFVGARQKRKRRFA